MDRRAITFVLLSTAIIFTWISIEQIFFPPPPPANRLAQENQDPASDDSPADPADPTSAEGPATTENPTSPDGTDPAPTEAEAGAPKPFMAEPTLAVLGSLAPSSPYRMLVTLDSRGGSVRRIELADRLANGQYRFKHVDDRAGYVGNLEVVSVESGGVRVGLVAPGSPASAATCPTSTVVGLQVGDVIEGVGAEPVRDADDWFRLINQTEIKDQIELRVKRGDESLVYTAELSARPMEIVQPLPENTSDPAKWHRPSFVLALGSLSNGGLWRATTADLESRDWAIEPTDEKDVVVFRFDLSEVDLANSRLKGPISILKRYRLAARDAESMAAGTSEKFDRTYHLEYEIEIRSSAPEEQELALQITGPSGVTEEGWWYINKIHGRSTAIFYSAGTKDVVGTSEGLGFRFLGGPEIVSNALTEGSSPLELFPQALDSSARRIKWAAVDTQYFNVALLPKTAEGEDPLVVMSSVAEPVEEVSAIDKKERRRADVSFRITTEPMTVSTYNPETGAGAKKLAFTIFAGPKFPALLEHYELTDNVSYGWFAWFSKPLVGLLHLFDALVGNYGIAIVMLTVIVRAAMIPISRKAALNAQMMQHLQPEMKKIAEQYKDDMEKRSKAQQELFRRYKYNPMGGCLLMFIQLPIFLGLYRGLSVDIALRDQPLIPGVDWCSNMAGPDRLFRWEGWMPFLTDETGWLGPYFNVLPIVTIVLFLIQQKLFMPPALDEQQRATQKMMTFMMVFMGLMFFKVPSGLCIYFITSSLWGIIERKMLPKPSLEGRLAAMEGSDKEAGSTDDSPREKSAAQARIEELRKRDRKRREK